MSKQPLETAFPMLQVMQIPDKPRKESMLLMSEVGIPMREAGTSSRSPRPSSITQRSPITPDSRIG